MTVQTERDAEPGHLLFKLCPYVFGLVSGAVLIPWLVDHGLFPVRGHRSRER